MSARQVEITRGHTIPGACPRVPDRPLQPSLRAPSHPSQPRLCTIFPLAGRQYVVSVQNPGLLPCLRQTTKSSSLHLSRPEKRVIAHEQRSNRKDLPLPNISFNPPKAVLVSSDGSDLVRGTTIHHLGMKSAGPNEMRASECGR